MVECIDVYLNWVTLSTEIVTIYIYIISYYIGSELRLDYFSRDLRA